MEEGHRRVMESIGPTGSDDGAAGGREMDNGIVNEAGDACQVANDPLKRRPYDGRSVGAEGRKYPQTRFKRRLVVMDEDYAMIAEQYRILYANIEQANTRTQCRAFAVTSSVKGEGKSITSLNLAYVMAREFKKKTILVECDLRKPSTVSAYLDPSCPHGTADVLKGEKELFGLIARVEDTRLHIVQAGNITRKSTEILDSIALKAIVKSLKAEFDYVILDSPPILPLVDMSIISRHVDGIIVVVRAGETPKDIVSRAIGSVSRSNILGMVLNSSDNRLRKYYY
jgi:capsular exopolysaccharide synthesis family protein